MLEVHPASAGAGTGGVAPSFVAGLEPVAIITAFNPYGRRDVPVANAARQRLLIAELDAAGRSWWPAVGISADGAWSEDSVAVPGLARAEARRIGARWRQEAIFEWQPAAGTLSIVACSYDRVVVARATVRRG